MLKNKALWTGGFFLLLLFLLATFGSYFSYVKEGMEGKRLIFLESGGIERAPFPPSADFPLGSDYEGRNMVSLLVMGAKDTLILIFLITSIRYIAGIVLGAIASFGGRMISSVLNVWDQIFSSMPVIFFAILAFNLPLLIYAENRFWIVIFSIALVEVGRVGVTIRDQLIHVKSKPYIEAARTTGLTNFGLATNHFLPILLPTMLVNFCFDIGRVALIIGQLGIFSIFITMEFVEVQAGLYQISNTSFNWPTILGDARKDIYTAVWIPAAAAFAIMYVILTFNILGEGLRRHFSRLGT
ncbi:ABC transporter permease subunit [Sutcliffiella horikoshii]|uniref:ABC transporter permease n=1 Tax=Sutcliffiella horikoshii TaxID=79883 RepID=UPI00203EA0D5|nr:ABC transporter permease subunit [Sutcliffiella horikoshii]MCM3618276.1 ABC transporter permease subunit [Sutcliffiella horikoshii]